MAYRYKNFAQWKDRHETSKFTLDPNLDCTLVKRRNAKNQVHGSKTTSSLH